MKLLEVLDRSIPKDDWDVHQMSIGGRTHTVYQFQLNDEFSAHVEFANLADIQQYFMLMQQLLIGDGATLYREVTEAFPQINTTSPITNIGFGVNMSPELQNFDDRSLALTMLSTVTSIVLDYHETARNAHYIFGTNHKKKLSTFERMLRRHVSNILRIENLPSSDGYDFLYVTT